MRGTRWLLENVGFGEVEAEAGGVGVLAPSPLNH